MSSEGPKMGGGRYGLAWNGRKKRKIRRLKVAAAVAFVGLIRARPASVGREISRRWSSGGGAPPCPARVARWWPEASLTTKTHLA